MILRTDTCPYHTTQSSFTDLSLHLYDIYIELFNPFVCYFLHMYAIEFFYDDLILLFLFVLCCFYKAGTAFERIYGVMRINKHIRTTVAGS